MVKYWQDTLEFFKEYIETPQQRRDLIRTFLPNMIEEGFSANKSFLEFKEAGFGVNWYAFRDIWQETRYEKALDFNIRFMPDDEIIRETYMTTSRNNFKARYKYVVSYGVQNEESGAINFSTFGYSTSEQLNKRDAINYAEEFILAKYPDRDDRIFGLSVKKVFINPDL